MKTATDQQKAEIKAARRLRIKKTAKNIAIFSILLAFIIGWSILIYFINPREMVGFVGVNNGYIISFLFGVIGEAATFTVLSYYPAIITLAAGGLNPFFLGIIAGLGMTIGNSIYFFLGERGRVILSPRLEASAYSVLRWIEQKPKWAVQILIFLYIGFTPFPNNLLTVSSGVAGFPYKRIVFPLILGNIVLTASIAYLTSVGLSLI